MAGAVHVARLLLPLTLLASVHAIRLPPPQTGQQQQLHMHTQADLIAKLPDKTSRPIICVLTQPGDLAGPGESYLSAGYVKWLESAGARVAPVLYDMSEGEIKDRFNTCNGLLFPGGNYQLTTSTRWFKAAELLYNLAVAANQQGQVFPILGTCLGLQVLATIVSRDYHALEPLEAHNHPTHVSWTDSVRHSQVLPFVPAWVLDSLQRHPIAMHNHYYGLTDSSMRKYSDLDRFFNVLAHSQDWNNVTYVSVIEAKDYPFLGLAFHLEKSAYEWTLDINIPHSRQSTDAAYHVAAAFVSVARKNSHRGVSKEQEEDMLIYNWQPEYAGKHRPGDSEGEERPFEQVYIFKLEDIQSRHTA